MFLSGFAMGWKTLPESAQNLNKLTVNLNEKVFYIICLIYQELKNTVWNS